MSTPALVDLVCAVLEDTYGRVGAQILRCLLNEGALTAAELAKKTALPLTAVQRTLVSLVTNRFALFWQQGARTHYFASWKQVYQILWAGQLLAHAHAEPDSLPALRDALLRGLVPASPLNHALIKDNSLVPAREWQFWPEDELVHSVHRRRSHQVANNPDSMAKSESAQKVQAANESQSELERIRAQIFVENPAAGADAAALLYTVNWDRFLIQSRRHEFAEFAARQIGAATGRIYEIVLRLSEPGVSSLRERRVPSLDLAVTTQQIVGQLDEKLLQEMAAAFDNPAAAAAADRGAGATDGDTGNKRLKTNAGQGVNVRAMKPAELVNKHLELLVESRAADFVQRMGTRQGGEWFVPFDKVNHRLKQAVFDEIVAQSLGEPASRLIGLIRQKGKLDEKMLGNFALLAASEIRHQMSALSYFGFADIQELAKPNERGGSGGAAGAAQKRSMFLWYHRPEWAYSRLLDQLYTQITALVKKSQGLRQDHRILLTKLSRDDVKSDINQFLTAKELEELEQYKQAERDIFKQMNMLDRHVRIFREY